MSRANRSEKMQMVRLAATIENLHDGATNPALSEEAGKEAAGQLGMLILRHLELITTALRIAGK